MQVDETHPKNFHTHTSYDEQSLDIIFIGTLIIFL